MDENLADVGGAQCCPALAPKQRTITSEPHLDNFFRQAHQGCHPRPSVLRSASWQRPDPILPVDLSGDHSANLATASAREELHAQHIGVLGRAIARLKPVPESAYLLIRKNTIPGA